MKFQRPGLKAKDRRTSKTLKITALGLFAILSILVTATNVYLYRESIDPYAFYSSLANPNKKYVYIPAGLRREEVVERFQEALSWDETEVKAFLSTAPSDERGFLDGYYFPGSYWVTMGDSGSDVAHRMLRSFNSKVSEKVLDEGSTKKQTSSNPVTNKSSVITAGNSTEKINLDTVVRIASIIQREAGGAYDMKIISGVIWNRMFRGMTLQMDATLQYAKGTPEKWWPVVTGKDKNIDSPFNTYQNKGLPPMAIANPSLAAIEAAMNPAKTDCMFYIHDRRGGFHCEKTYEEHVKNVEKYLIGKK